MPTRDEAAERDASDDPAVVAPRWDRMTPEERFLDSGARCKAACAEQEIPFTLEDPAILAKVGRIVAFGRSASSPRNRGPRPIKADKH